MPATIYISEQDKQQNATRAATALAAEEAAELAAQEAADALAAQEAADAATAAATAVTNCALRRNYYRTTTVAWEA